MENEKIDIGVCSCGKNAKITDYKILSDDVIEIIQTCFTCKKKTGIILQKVENNKNGDPAKIIKKYIIND